VMSGELQYIFDFLEMSARQVCGCSIELFGAWDTLGG
jgi:hypothetical protein